jgi:hypothetical protein
MPKFRLLVTRDTTQSTVVEVEATDEDEAGFLARQQVRADQSKFDWELDDTPNASKDPYVTDCEELD